MIDILRFQEFEQSLFFVDETRVNIEDLLKCGVHKFIRVHGDVTGAVVVFGNPDASFDYVAGAISEDV